MGDIAFIPIPLGVERVGGGGENRRFSPRAEPVSRAAGLAVPWLLVVVVGGTYVGILPLFRIICFHVPLSGIGVRNPRFHPRTVLISRGILHEFRGGFPMGRPATRDARS